MLNLRSRFWGACRAALAALMMSSTAVGLSVGIAHADFRPPSSVSHEDPSSSIDQITGRIQGLEWQIVGGIAFIAVAIAVGAFMADRPDLGRRILIGVVIGVILSIIGNGLIRRIAGQ